MKKKLILKKHDFVIKLSVALFLALSVVQNNVNYVGCDEQFQSYFGDDPHRGSYSNQYSSSSSNGLTLDSAAFKQGIVKDCLQQCPDQVGFYRGNFRFSLKV